MKMEKPETNYEDSSRGHVATRIRVRKEKAEEENPRLRGSGEHKTTGQEADDHASVMSQANSQHTFEQRENRSSSCETIHSELKEVETFKGWLSARIMDGLNTAAGATLSTTGQLIAPPLHVTKTVILPSLLGLFVDTLDTVTPQRLKDWFRIISSSLHHLVSVIRSTKGGKQFSSRFLEVTQDIALVTSAPETRNILIDTMALGVKTFDALNTEEVRVLMDHIASLACRVVDVAASGKTKQLFHSMKGMMQDCIEMGSDPAATVAFAEVTAHLCYALEDIYLSLEPKNRPTRNKQNRETYLTPLEVSDLHNQPSVEQVILGCLGRLEANVADLPRQGETKQHSPNLNDRIETVDIEYLRNNVFLDAKATDLSPALSDSNNDPITERTLSHTTDIEDFKDRSEDRQKEASRNSRQDTVYQNIAEPPVKQFYETLDTFLQRNKSKHRETVVAPSSPSTMGRRRDEGKHAEMLRAKVKNLKRRLKTTGRERHRRGPDHSPSKYPPMMSVFGSVIVLALVILWLGFGVYGVYSLTKLHLMENRHNAQEQHPQQSEVVFRIVREVRHFNADEKEAMHSTFSTAQELNAVTDCISSRLEEIDSD